jgi:arylsulfatase A-like enzyme
VSEHVSGFQDFLPTAAELAGTKVETACDGISFVPELLGKHAEQKQHPYLFWSFNEQGGKRSVLQWPWKLIHLNTGSTDAAPKKAANKTVAAVKPMEVQLFNMEADPAEQKNVAAENPAIVQRLEGLMLEAWRAP